MKTDPFPLDPTFDHSKLMRQTILTTSLALAAISAPLRAQTANFDAQPEGGYTDTYEENGIVFSDLDAGSPFFHGFVIEDASQSLTGMPGFSSPNTLGFVTYSPGPNGGYGPCGSFDVTPPQQSTYAELHFFIGPELSAGNELTLEAHRGGALVASDSAAIPFLIAPQHVVLVISGTYFDQLRVVGSGPANGGVVLAALDEVLIVPDFVGTNYCTSSPNSTGGAAIMSATGSASLAANDLVLHATPVPSQPGVFYYGPSQVNLAFGNGTRCVGGTVGRFAVTSAVAGSLDQAVDYATPPSPPLQITAGSTWNFQAWFRDPAAGGSSFDLSDGFEISFVP